MPIDQVELGRRVRQAREACGLTQGEVAEKLRVSRPTVVQMEQGKRAITGLELHQLAYLLGRDIRDFLAHDFAEDDVVRVLFRSQDDAGEDDAIKPALRDCIALGHELTNLEDLLGMSRGCTSMAAYSLAVPSSKWEAIQGGARAAREERRRLGLGSAPLGDLVALLEAQGVRTGMVSMPAEVSGLMISHPRVGLFVVINRDHPAARQRFSWCHEYAHVLLDRDSVGLISRESERNNLREVRANSFSASLLMPEEGVRQLISGLGKGTASRVHAEIFDEAGVVPVDSRTEPGSQDLQLYDVVQMAHFFGASVLSALYRLRNLKLLSEAEFERLKTLDGEGKSRKMAELLGLPLRDSIDDIGEFHRRYLGLALEALRREKISHAKFLELADRVGVNRPEAESLLESAGLDSEEPESVLLPEG